MSLKKKVRRAELRKLQQEEYEQGLRRLPPAPIVAGVQTRGVVGLALRIRQAKKNKEESTEESQ